VDFTFNFDEVYYQNETSFFWGILVNIIVGLLTGFIASISVLWIQFNKSDNYRLLIEIEEATTKLYDEIFRQQESTDKDLLEKHNRKSFLRDKYKHRLSVIIDRLFSTYGGHSIKEKEGKYPLLIAYDAEQPKDRWDFYYRYLKDLISPLNSYSFLSSIIFIRRNKTFKKIIILSQLVNQIEKIVGIHDGIIDLISDHKEYIKIDGETFSFFLSGHLDLEDISSFKNELDELKTIWNKWLDLVLKN